MASNTDYTRFTYQQLLEDFSNRLKSDERFKNLSAASIYQMFMEMLTCTVDQTNFMIQRTAEEAFIDSARLDSSVIKYARNLGYSPKRQTPAECEVMIKIRGPLPPELKPGATLYFSQNDVDLTFNDNKFMLATDYSYTFDEADIRDGASSTWSKTLVFARNSASMRYYELGGIKLYSAADAVPLKAFQGELKLEVFNGISNLRKIGKNYQYYDVNDLEWSNWYGRRDPNAYSRGRYYKTNGYTKIGIGQTQDEAFKEDYLFDIEDCSIYLNEGVLEWEDSDENDPLRVCQVTTNQDKTVRIQFGDGVITRNGIIRDNENLYVQYLKTKGADANTLGTTGSIFSTTCEFLATQPGGTVELTSNVQMLLNSDIIGGTDFETAQSIKNHAPAYYAAAGRLVTKKDFISYFSQMTSPVKVKSANAWGQEEIEELFEGGTTTYKYMQNLVMYCIASSTYNINGKLNSVRNVLDESDDAFGAFTVFGSGTAYLEHLTDYIKMLLSFNSFKSQQEEKNPSKQWLKNIKKIRQQITPKMIMNSKVYAMPPFVQYFDVCGSVEIESLAKLQDYKIKVENDIYEWLSDNTAFNTPIYKADILKFYANRPETKAINLDIKVSEWIKGVENCLSYNIADRSFTQVFSMNKNLPGSPTYTNEGNMVNYNVISLPKIDANGNRLTADSLRNKNIRLKTYCYNSGDRETKFRNEFQLTPYEVTETSTNIVISMYGYQQRSRFDQITAESMIYVYVVSSGDFASTTQFSTSNSDAYGLTPNQVAQVENELKRWIQNATVVREANRAIPLPYYIESMDEITRQETIMRIGAVQNKLETELTEKSFWQYMVPKIISKYYYSSFTDLNDEDVDGTLWTHINNLVVDIYKLMKATFCDSVLDDNNNIVNFSMDNELPVVRLNVTYKYKG